jgi:hypothetical protein
MSRFGSADTPGQVPMSSAPTFDSRIGWRLPRVYVLQRHHAEAAFLEEDRQPLSRTLCIDMQATVPRCHILLLHSCESLSERLARTSPRLWISFSGWLHRLGEHTRTLTVESTVSGEARFTSARC